MTSRNTSASDRKSFRYSVSGNDIFADFTNIDEKN
jgi:hypothetical protein